MKRLEAIVKGTVQGVGYRGFAWNKANYLGLTGFTKNLVDGSVEVTAEGKKEKLEQLLKELEKGPPLSYIEKVDSSWSEAINEFKEFSIRY